MATRKPKSTNGNGHSAQSINKELIMIASPENSDHQANSNPSLPDLTFEEACQIAGGLSPYALREALEVLAPDLDAFNLISVPAATLPLLHAIAIKKASATPQLEAAEIPLIDDSAIISTAPETAEIKKDPSNKRLTAKEKAQKLEETIVGKVNQSKEAESRRESKEKAALIKKLGNRQLKGQIAAVSEVLVEKAAQEQVFNAFNAQAEDRDAALSDAFLLEVNQLLTDAGVPLSIVLDTPEVLNQDFLAEQASHENLLSIIQGILPT